MEVLTSAQLESWQHCSSKNLVVHFGLSLDTCLLYLLVEVEIEQSWYLFCQSCFKITNTVTTQNIAVLHTHESYNQLRIAVLSF